MSASTSRQSCFVVGTAPWSAIWARIASSASAVGAHLDQGIARIVPGLADRDLDDAKRPAAGHDRIQNLRQNQAVDNVAGDFHFLDEGVLRDVQDAVDRVLDMKR